MKQYICLVVLTFVIASNAGLIGSGHPIVEHTGGHYFGHGIEPARILKVQEISTAHGGPHGRPVLLKVFYNGHIEHNPAKVIKVIHEDGHNGFHYDPHHNHHDHFNNHEVIKVIHEEHPSVHPIYPVNHDPKIVKVIHHHNPSIPVVNGPIPVSNIVKIINGPNTVYENKLLGGHYGSGFAKVK